MHYWTTWLNNFFHVTLKKSRDGPVSLITALQKVVVHEAVYDPFFVVSFLFLLRLWDSRGDIRSSFQGAKMNFWPALQNQWKVWPLIHVLNYGLVAPKLQVGFISGVAILTNAYLTWLSKKKVGK